MEPSSLALQRITPHLPRPAATDSGSNYPSVNCFSSARTTFLSRPRPRQFQFRLHASASSTSTAPAAGKPLFSTHGGSIREEEEVVAVNSSSDEAADEEEEEEEEEEEDEDYDDEEYADEDEEEEEDEGDTASFLSLSMKPDRNMALLDDYEIEEFDFTTDPNHRSGYVAVVGLPNVGKSTLSNQMIGQKLSIVTDKPQTTRHRILGICSAPEYQIILYDTPGVIEKEMHKLDSMMMKNVRTAAINADCVLLVVDACKMPKNIDDLLPAGTGESKSTVPVLLVLNKKDLIKPGEVKKKLEWYEKFTNVDEVIPVSAKYGHGVDDVKDWILTKLPLGPAYYPKDITSEHPERFFVGEIVREKIFMQYRNEVPYACQVNVVTYKARPGAKEFIKVEVVVEKNTQKIIIIGKDGKSLKLLATAARLDIEDFLQKKVYLEVEVKVKEKWRQDEGLLNYYGYGGQIRVF